MPRSALMACQTWASQSISRGLSDRRMGRRSETCPPHREASTAVEPSFGLASVAAADCQSVSYYHRDIRMAHFDLTSATEPQGLMHSTNAPRGVASTLSGRAFWVSRARAVLPSGLSRSHAKIRSEPNPKNLATSIVR